MRICQEHWGRLRTAIEERGLASLISGDGHKLMDKLQSELAQGGQTVETYDPLSNANFAIWSNALERGGPYLMGQKENGEHYCPICESVEHGGPDADWWINSAADEQREKALAMGLIPGVQ